MTYLREGFEYLDADETAVYEAIGRLTAARRTGNNSQVASYSGLSRTRVGQVTDGLRARGFIHNVSKGAAYHWRQTGLPIPYSVEARREALALKRRQRELNERIREGR